MVNGKVWAFFERFGTNSNEKKARCLLCSRSYSYSSTTANLRQHLKRKHSTIIIGEDEAPRRPSVKHNLSFTWRYFTKVEDNEYQKTAECQICHRVLNWSTTSANLRRHLHIMHADMVPPPNEGDVEEDTNDEEKAKRKSYNEEETRDGEEMSDDDRVEEEKGTKRKRYSEEETREGEEMSDGDREEEQRGEDGEDNEEVAEEKRCDFQEAEDSALDLEDEAKPVNYESTTTPLVEAGKWFHVWEYFTKLKRGNFRAKCSICSNELSFRTSTGPLKYHLYNSHPDLFPGNKTQYRRKAGVEREDGDEEGASENPDSANESLVYLDENERGKPIWRFFKQLGRSTGVSAARCLLCRGAFYYRNTRILGNHLKKFHLGQYLECCSLADGAQLIEFLDNEAEGEEQLPSTSLSGVFRSAGSGARCTLCGERVGRREHDLRDHLATCHRKIVEEIEDSNSSDRNPLQDVDDGELIRRLRDSPSPPRRKTRRESSRREERREERREDRREARRKSPGSDDEVGSFLVYLGTLLRSVPRENSARLQADIVSLVASSRTEYEKKKASVTAQVLPAPKYIITIPSASQGVPGGVKEIIISKEDQQKVQGELVTLVQTKEYEGMEVTEGQGSQGVVTQMVLSQEVRPDQGESGTGDV